MSDSTPPPTERDPRSGPDAVADELREAILRLVRQAWDKSSGIDPLVLNGVIVGRLCAVAFELTAQAGVPRAVLEAVVSVQIRESYETEDRRRSAYACATIPFVTL